MACGCCELVCGCCGRPGGVIPNLVNVSAPQAAKTVLGGILVSNTPSIRRSRQGHHPEPSPVDEIGGRSTCSSRRCGRMARPSSTATEPTRSCGGPGARRRHHCDRQCAGARRQAGLRPAGGATQIVAASEMRRNSRADGAARRHRTRGRRPPYPYALRQWPGRRRHDGGDIHLRR